MELNEEIPPNRDWTFIREEKGHRLKGWLPGKTFSYLRGGKFLDREIKDLTNILQKPVPYFSPTFFHFHKRKERKEKNT